MFAPDGRAAYCTLELSSEIAVYSYADGQLSEAIEDMQRRKGVVANIKGNSGSKSAELSEALAGDKKVIVCTIQTFPFA